MAGTFHQALAPELSIESIDETTLESFLADLNEALPSLELDHGDVLRVLWGLLPAAQPGTADLAVRPVIVDHAVEGGPRGLFSVSGVKFTTARLVAEKTLRVIARAAGRRLAQVGRSNRPQPSTWPSVDELHQLVARDPGSARSRLRGMMETESALYPEDLVLRRTDWGSDPREAARIRESIARLLA